MSNRASIKSALVAKLKEINGTEEVNSKHFTIINKQSKESTQEY